ncbi:MAG: primosomal protein N' [Hydrogenovibrio sp.]|uniref:primosomal protein N' n=1 Tax=Hydrogenovibrio sp. TaxID=2065821 RepID=UPI00287099E1|nr:primosomal protein N' [Hydrogenovibrio sp.]MDR9499891.1 primosomal protein N' [Hydrogenovibrio sp.]
MTQNIVKVAVPGPFLSPMDYDLPADLSPQTLQPGMRVRVPFRAKSQVGLVMALVDHSDVPEHKRKAVEAVLDEQPLLSSTDQQFWQWLSHYYHQPIGEVVATALPKRLRQGEAATPAGTTAWRLTQAGQAAEADISPRAHQQTALWQQLKKAESNPVTAQALNQVLTNWRPALKRFEKQGWVETVQVSCLAGQRPATRPHQTNPILNPEQQAAVDQVDRVAQSGEFGAFLLEGVTGSGKTEAYLGMIERVIERGRQALVLVPEIGLTPQTVARFEAYLGQPVAVMHSGLNDSERHCAWSAVRQGDVAVLLGTRSALFTPFQNLGLCILDEEHDLSFKQQDGVRYSARDALVRRAHLEQVPVVLGSATPSLESLRNADLGRYQSLHLTQRAAGASMPALRLLDVRGAAETAGVSDALMTAMEAHLNAGHQVLLFLNRRGFAPVMMCHDCGWQAQCADCDANMTWHAASRLLKCHHCNAQSPPPPACPNCGSVHFARIGQGTEQLEAAMRERFPDKSLLRIDRDTTRLKGQMQKLTDQARAGDADILIGTQMLAKGHHFPKVTLVGMIDLDQGLFSCDYRAAERMAQLVIQVAGRAGRGEQAGEVLIQTHHPQHPLLTRLVERGYGPFAEAALREREAADLPPFSHQILIRAESVEAGAAETFLKAVKNGLNSARMPKQPSETGAFEWPDQRLWAAGPVVAPMMRRQKRWRYQLLLQGDHRGRLHSWLAQVESQFYSHPLARKVRWSIDVDPQEMV